MRIGIDARAAVEVRAGRGTLVRELIRSLRDSSAEHEYVLAARERWDEPLDERFSWWLDGASDPWWNVKIGATAHRRCDVFVSTNSYLTVWFLRVPSVMVVCDMVTFHDEYRPQRRAKVIERATLPLAARRAEVFAAISQATADDLAAHFPRAAGKTIVTPLAADEHFFAAIAGDVRGRLGLERPYVLAVGTLEPRKNLPALIEAFIGLPEETHDLVLVGALGWETGETQAAIARHPGRIRALGHVPDDDLTRLYAGAALFAYPSLYEGFGLPVLEAMAAGAPVLTSDISSLPEVAGDAAILVDPRSVDSIRDGLRRALSDPPRGGREHARTFSWARYAEQILQACATARRNS
jgi:glycosyltransferase involved in cell wall biosynthesis